ncbi:alkaline phosphatase family protein [Sphingomonas oleivorans]|uniref:alkaline phosphatase family protein n=1 Tax=Sphingomonas oleivorans TaxID=1735121 RepID=UPI001FAFCDF1|nr:alkaline phosphatase family protein [Sphingomonas oleivorans]
MKRLFVSLAALLSATAAPAAPPPPKLIVAISVDQFSADLFAEYRQIFTGGMKRLASGAVFPSGYQSHAATETCPGHSTILTGSHPARTGIIANNWIDQSVARADKNVYCAEDPTAPGSDHDNYVPSTLHLKVPTLGDRMKSADARSRVVSVAGKDRAAIMMGGHATDQIWFWGGKSFVTLADHKGPPPAIVSLTNARLAALIARPAVAKLPPVCRSRSVAVPVGGREVGVLADRAAEDFRGFRAAGEFDAATADLAIGLLKDMKLGQGPAPDLLTIGLSATDYVGHGFGVEGAEMCAQMMALDATVGRILAALDGSGVPYAVVLTADHGGHDLPERNLRRAFGDAQRADPALSPGTFGKALAADLGFGDRKLLLGDGPFGDWYLARDIDAVDRPRILSAARAKLLAHPQVEAVFTAEELRRMPDPQPPVEEWSVRERVRASFDPERSGDLIVILKPHVTPISDPSKGYVATHGSPWAYDRRVPILFLRPGATSFEQPLSVETVDILPTLAALIGLDVPKDQIDGRCLDLDPGEAGTCPAK